MPAALKYGGVAAVAIFFVGEATGMGGSFVPNVGCSCRDFGFSGQLVRQSCLGAVEVMAPQTIEQINKPELTFSKPEADWVTQAYKESKVILEYGSGGSTVLAGEQLGASVYSVESDLQWAANLSAWFVANPPLANVQIHPVDIGKPVAGGAITSIQSAYGIVTTFNIRMSF